MAVCGLSRISLRALSFILCCSRTAEGLLLLHDESNSMTSRLVRTSDEIIDEGVQLVRFWHL